MTRQGRSSSISLLGPDEGGLAFGCPEDDEDGEKDEGKHPCPDGDGFHCLDCLGLLSVVRSYASLPTTPS